MSSSEVIKHSGEVVRIEADSVFVRMSVGSSCGSCHARSVCGASEIQEKIVQVKNCQGHNYHIGDRVEVALQSRSMGVKSVLAAYVIPLFVLCCVLFGTVALGVNEGIAALLSLGGVAIYYVLLYFLDDKVGEKIKFIIIK